MIVLDECFSGIRVPREGMQGPDVGPITSAGLPLRRLCVDRELCAETPVGLTFRLLALAVSASFQGPMPPTNTAAEIAMQRCPAGQKLHGTSQHQRRSGAR